MRLRLTGQSPLLTNCALCFLLQTPPTPAERLPADDTKPLNFDTIQSQGLWSLQRSYGGVQVLQTTIPLKRLEEFKADEEQRLHNIQFQVESSHVDGNKCCPKYALEKKVYHCQFGPEDHTTPDAIASSQAAEAAGEKKVRHWSSISS